MSITVNETFSFGTGNASLTDLRVQPRKVGTGGVARANAGPLLAPAFTNDGKGLYSASFDVPDDAVDMVGYSLATPTIKSIRTVQAPAEAGSTPPISPGASPMTWTVTVDNVALADADAWITRDIAGLQVVDRKRTDTAGNVRFLADKYAVDGTTLITYYAWAQKDGVRSIQADPITCD